MQHRVESSRSAALSTVTTPPGAFFMHLRGRPLAGTPKLPDHIFRSLADRGYSSVVEHLTSNRGVVGSNPIISTSGSQSRTRGRRASGALGVLRGIDMGEVGEATLPKIPVNGRF